MWPGFVALGPGDPFQDPNYVELVNNQRVYSYARQAGLSWLQECLDCPEAGLVMPGGPEFISPSADPAPWYDPDNQDTWGFLGVAGLEVVGADTSTRQVTITNTLQVGGIAGPPYFGPRTMVFRGLLVATDECSLQAGMDWLRATTVVSEDPCHGDALTFFDCCPCVCDDDTPTGPCWAGTYAELTNGPMCAGVTPPVPAYFDGTLGVGPRSADPGVLPDNCTLIFHIRHPELPVTGPIAAQWESTGNQRSWRVDNSTPSPASLDLVTSSNGTATSLTQNVTGGTGHGDEMLAISREVVGGVERVHSWIRNAAGVWGRMGFSSLVTKVNPFDATTLLRIGHTLTGGTGGTPTSFEGRIYSVELRQGSSPIPGAWDAGEWDGQRWDIDTGQLLWRFDASEYPGSGTTYTDPRGRVWTVDPATIIPPEAGEPVDVWWPVTYAELTSGPPAGDPDWCSWPHNYYDLTNGPPGWACCVNECVVPYLRQFYNARITEGPVILRQPVMSCGALAEIEVTLVAADPRKYTMPSTVLRVVAEPGEPHEEMDLATLAAEVPDPFAIPGVTVARRTTTALATRTVERPAMRTTWMRSTHTTVDRPATLRDAVPIVVLAAIDGDVGEVRVGLWSGGSRIGGFWLPFVPGGSMVTIDATARRVYANPNGTARPLTGFVRDYDGGRVQWPELPRGVIEVTVDQEPERAGRLVVEVHAVDISLS